MSINLLTSVKLVVKWKKGLEGHLTLSLCVKLRECDCRDPVVPIHISGKTMKKIWEFHFFYRKKQEYLNY